MRDDTDSFADRPGIPDHVLAAHQGGAFGGPGEGGKHLHERRLAGAVRPEDRQEDARLHAQVDTAQRFHRP